MNHLHEKTKKYRGLLAFLIAFLITVSCSTESTPVYKLTSVAEPAEAGTVSPATAEAEEGDSIQLTASANEHWLFDRWGGDHSGTGNPGSVLMNSDKSVTALFIKRDYLLKINLTGEGSVQEEIVQQKATDYEHGTIVQLTADAEEGWVFSGWEGDIVGDENPATIEITGEKEVTAVFERLEFALTINVEGEGEVSQKIVQAKSTDYPFESVVELTAKPSTDWGFSHWEGDFSGSENPAQIEMSDNREVTAVFSRFHRHENGVTVKCPFASGGEKGMIDGVEYEAVNRNLLDQRRDDGSDLSKVCTSLVTDMNDMFLDAASFNQDIGNWDVSNVTTMRNKFRNATSFNQDIGSWVVSKVTNMTGLLDGASSFNQDISGWDVDKVEFMTVMFRSATSFNQDIGSWNVSNVKNMFAMFQSASAFNQNIGNWNVSNVMDMARMFRDAATFNHDVSDWCVSNIPLEPSQFSAGSPLLPEYQPVWGTCPGSNTDDPQASRIEVLPGDVNINFDETQIYQFSAVVYDQFDEQMVDGVVTWSSSNTDVATVDSEGRATALSLGEVQIIASSGSVSNSANLKMVGVCDAVVQQEHGGAPNTVEGNWLVCNSRTGKHEMNLDLVHEEGSEIITGTMIRPWGHTSVLMEAKWESNVIDILQWSENVGGSDMIFFISNINTLGLNFLKGRYNNRVISLTYDVYFVRIENAQ